MGTTAHRARSRTSIISALALLTLGVSDAVAQSGGETSRRTVPHDPGFASIYVIARPSADSVILRWAPSTPHAWRLCNRIGYTVERRSAGGERVMLTPQKVFPWDPERIAGSMTRTPRDRFIGVAALALWSDTTLIGVSDSLGLDTLEANAERNTMLYGYALFSADNDPRAAEILGLRYVDRMVRKGETYTYIVSMAEPRDYRVAAGEVTVTAERGQVSLPPPNAFTARGLDGRIELSWEVPAFEYTGYDVFRSDDGGKTFRKLTTTPLVILRNENGIPPRGGFVDTTAVNNISYIYRVQGNDPFGMAGEPAEARAAAHDLTPPFPPLVRNPEQIGDRRIKLSWEVPEVVPDLAGFIISRSAVSDSGFRSLTEKPLARTARSFTDDNPDDREPFYIVSAIDTAGNTAHSLPLYGFVIDTIPPAVPTGLVGTIDSSGVVTLRWNANRERNLLGYRVLWANAADHEFSQRTGQVWKDTVFHDTVEVNTLTKHVYYQVAAVNWNYNHSLPCAPVEIRRPDVVPPESPVFTDVLATDSSLILRWVPSGSDDVREHVLLRHVSGEEAWIPITTLRRDADTYEDKDVRVGLMYEYQLEAVDSSGLRARADVAVQGRPYDTGLRPPVSDLRASWDEQRNTVTLQWRYTKRGDEAIYYVIYRSFGDHPLLPLVSLEIPDARYTDTALVGDGVYTYAVKVMTRGGAESPLSERVSVRVGAER
ncbi:MAG: hypothetical protein QHI48_06190 [Bacteroidota bacterium]|nr:hypothetical protein [Bacteroidota bacterium]